VTDQVWPGGILAAGSQTFTRVTSQIWRRRQAQAHSVASGFYSVHEDFAHGLVARVDGPGSVSRPTRAGLFAGRLRDLAVANLQQAEKR
jgi:hypothetical protein